MDKICSRCKQSKDHSQFYKKIHKSSGLSSECKECSLAYIASKKNRKPDISGLKICNSCNIKQPKINFNRHTQSSDGLRGDCKSCFNDLRKHSRYGLNKAQYEELCEKHEYRCGICKKHKTIIVDHCHSSNQVRGMLCNDCNTAIGKLGDTIQGVQAALDYLMQSSGRQ